MLENFNDKGQWRCYYPSALWYLEHNGKVVKYEFQDLSVLLKQPDLFGPEISSLIKQPDIDRLESQRKMVSGLLNVSNITPAYFFYQISVADGLTRNYVAGGEDIETILKAADIPYKVWVVSQDNKHYYYELQ